MFTKLIKFKELKEELNLNTQDTIDLVLKNDKYTYNKHDKSIDYGDKIIVCFVRANLEDANLTKADLRFIDLRYANLRGAGLIDAKLSYADLTEANLEGAYLRGADLIDANLTKANLKGANLEGANLRYVKLTEDTKFDDAIITESNKKYYTKKRQETMRIYDTFD